MTPSTGAREQPIWGLERIALALGFSLRKLKRLLSRAAGERPPVRHSHRGYYAYPSRLQNWVDCEDMDAGVHIELQRAKHLTREDIEDTREEHADVDAGGTTRAA